jgi:hypothetical protein
MLRHIYDVCCMQRRVRMHTYGTYAVERDRETHANTDKDAIIAVLNLRPTISAPAQAQGGGGGGGGGGGEDGAGGEVAADVSSRPRRAQGCWRCS